MILIQNINVVPLKILNKDVTKSMYNMSLKNLKDFVHILTLCLRQDINTAKNSSTKESLKEHVISLFSRLNIDKLKKVLFIVTMDFKIDSQHDYLFSEESNLLFLRNKSQKECYKFIVDKLSKCSSDELFYIKHILLLECSGHISFKNHTDEKKAFETFQNWNLDESERLATFLFLTLDDYNKWDKFLEFNKHIRKVMNFESSSKKITDQEALALYQKEGARRIKEFTLEHWMLYNSLIKLGRKKIIFFY